VFKGIINLFRNEQKSQFLKKKITKLSQISKNNTFFGQKRTSLTSKTGLQVTFEFLIQILKKKSKKSEQFL